MTTEPQASGSAPAARRRIERLRAIALIGLCVALAGSAACDRSFEGGGALRARKVALAREVDGIRDMVAVLEKDGTLIPENDVAVAIDESLVQDIISAQLPFQADVDAYHLTLSSATVTFQGTQVVSLSGSLFMRERPALAADISAMGAIDELAIDPATSTLRAKLAVDHIAIDRVAGLEAVLSGAALDELARRARLEVAGRLPSITIPVKVQQTIDVPRVVAGPVRIEAASLPLQVSVSRVSAGRGRLWIGFHFEPGEFQRSARR